MPTSTITDKGQTTVPLEIRRALGLKPRQRIEWEQRGADAAVIRPARSVSVLAGRFKSKVRYPGLKREKRAAVEAWSRETRGEERK